MVIFPLNLTTSFCYLANAAEEHLTSGGVSGGSVVPGSGMEALRLAGVGSPWDAAIFTGAADGHHRLQGGSNDNNNYYNDFDDDNEDKRGGSSGGWQRRGGHRIGRSGGRAQPRGNDRKGRSGCKGGSRGGGVLEHD